ncbi:MAG: MFS transporter, partial [Nitrospinota bacterium]
MTTTDARDGIQLKPFLLLAGAHLLTDAYSIALSPLLPLLVKKLHLSLTLAGMLASVFAISSSLLQPVYGMLSDRFNSRIFILLGPLAPGLCMSSLGVAPNFWVLALLLLLAGIGPAAFHPQAAATAGRLSGSRKG